MRKQAYTFAQSGLTPVKSHAGTRSDVFSLTSRIDWTNVTVANHSRCLLHAFFFVHHPETCI